MSNNRSEATGLKQAGKALEESFFAKENERLLKKLQESRETMERREALKEAMNLDDDEIIDALIKLDVKPETCAALGVVPLVEIAWADGTIQHQEREAILKAAEERGIKVGTPCHDLLEAWLTHKPGPELMATWKEYAHELHEALDPASAGALKYRLVERARSIAKSAGGILGMMRISKAEQAVIEELEHALE